MGADLSGMDRSETEPAHENAYDLRGNQHRKRGTGGRPRKQAADRRTHKYLVSVNAAEREAIEAGAAATGLVPSVYLRQAAIGVRLNGRHDDLLYHRISQVGVALLQLAKQSGAEGRDEEQAELNRLVDELRAILAML